jgi:hypothetical protein
MANLFANFVQQLIVDWAKGEIAKTGITIAQSQIRNAAQSSGGGGGGVGGGSWMGGLSSMGSASMSGGSSGASTMGSAMGSGSALGFVGWVAVIVAVFAAFTHYMETHTAKNADSNVGLSSTGSGIFYGGLSTNAGGHNGAQVQQAAAAIANYLNGFVSQVQAIVGSSVLSTIRKKNQGKKTDWVVYYGDGLAQHFGKDQQAAEEFAAVQILKASDLRGLPPEVRDAIATSTARTMDGINGEVTAAFQAVSLRLGSKGSEVYDIFRKYAGTIEIQIQKGIEALNQAMHNALQSGPGGVFRRRRRRPRRYRRRWQRRQAGRAVTRAGRQRSQVRRPAR